MGLWNYIPKWMLNILESKLCSNCSQVVNKKDIVAVGIRNVEESECKTTLYSEHCCSKCNKRFITSFAREYQANVEDICYMLIENMQNQRKLEKSRKLSNSDRIDAISDKEFRDVKKFLSQPNSHNDFMKFINGPRDKKVDPDEAK